MPYVSRRIPLAILFVVATVTIANYFLRGSPELANTAKIFNSWAVVLFAFAMAVGLVQLTVLRVRWVMNPKESMRRRVLSILFLAEMWIIVLLGLTQSSKGPQFSWVSRNIYTTLQGAQYGMIGFYITLACYRTMKVRRWDIAIFTIVCWIHLVANTPLVSYFIGFGWFNFSQWIYFWPSTAGGKALAMIAALGMISVGVRGMLGMERGVLGGGGG
ncbi:MAG: hypothetical protein QXF26_01020 [Candidatus Bathyarchaeia archaeon]